MDMLNVSRETFVKAPGVEASAAPARHIRPVSVLTSMRKHATGSLLLVLLFVGLGLGYALTSTPLYTASTDILIDARRSHANEAGAANRSLAELGMDPASIDSQVAVLGSEQTAVTALKAMHLDHDAEFAAPTTLPGVLVQDLKHLLRKERPDDGVSGVPSDILDGFMKSVDVKRVQQTYVLSLSFTARSADRAAAIVNTLANVYMNGQVQAALDSRKLADAWVNDRAVAARNEVAASEQALRSLKSEFGSGLVADDPGAAGQGQDRLRALERSLDNQRQLYAALLDRANASLQQQSMPVSDASILKPARPPQRTSAPNTPLVIVLSAMAGVAAALGFSTWREMADKTFRVPSQIEIGLGVRFLGVLPRVRLPRRDRRSVLRGDWTRRDRRDAGMGRQAGPAEAIRASFHGPLRAVKLAADGCMLHDKIAVVGVTSAIAGEGRSTVALNLAGVIAGSGRRTLLVDADLRNPGVSLACAPQRHAGLVELLAGKTTSLADAVIRDEVAGVDILPSCGAEADSTSAMLGHNDIEKLSDQARENYDVIVLDLPPLAALAEVTAVASAVGALVLVVGWGHTQRAIVDEALQSSPSIVDRLVGAVFNKVDIGALRRLVRDPRDAFYLAGAKRPRAA